MQELFGQVWDILGNLFSLDGGQTLIRILQQPGYEIAALVALTAIVFTETGLLIGFFLPGDTLLVIAGVACAAAGWNLPLLLLLLCLAAIIGDSVGYAFGYHTGPKLFNREQSLLFDRDHLLKARSFYERHGGKTVILARFVPFLRTFVPLVAGIGRMDYRRFVVYNVAGGILWVVSMILTGYFLKDAIDPLFRWLLGQPEFTVLTHLEKVIVLVLLASLSPGAIAWLRHRFRRPESQPVGVA